MFSGRKEEGFQTQQTPEAPKLRSKTKKGNSRGGAPALTHHPAAVETTSSPEKGVECAHTTSQPFGVLKREIRAGQSTDAGQAAPYLLEHTVLDCTAALNLIRDDATGHHLGCDDGRCIDWRKWHVVLVISSLCLLYVSSTGRWQLRFPAWRWLSLGCGKSFLG